MHIEVYSDGSATTKEKPGGWGYVLVIDGVKHSEGKGHMAGASNNDAEMEAAIQGLAAVLKHLNDPNNFVAVHEDMVLVPPQVTLVSDSQLILGWASGVYRFKQADKYAKYKQLEFLMKRLGAKTRHVKGHSGDEHNERCDKLANLGRTQKEEEIKAEVAKATFESSIGTKKTGTFCVWYKGTLKVIDLDSNVIENHERAAHGIRGAILEIREEKSR